MTRTYRITVKTSDGGVVYTGTLTAEEIVEIRTKDIPGGNGQVAADPGERMTDPQRRYLFRLLASQGLEGKQVEQHLKDHFKVTRLRDITRQAASEYLDRLVKEQADATA
jgi:hypothetical protein